MTKRQANKLRGLLAEFRYQQRQYIQRGREDTQEQEFIEDNFYAYIRELTTKEQS